MVESFREVAEIFGVNIQIWERSFLAGSRGFSLLSLCQAVEAISC